MRLIHVILQPFCNIYFALCRQTLVEERRKTFNYLRVAKTFRGEAITTIVSSLMKT